MPSLQVAFVIPKLFCRLARKDGARPTLSIHYMQGSMYTIELLTRQGWSRAEAHEQRELAEMQAMLKSQADGQTYRVTSPELSTLCVFTQQGARCWELDQPTVA